MFCYLFNKITWGLAGFGCCGAIFNPSLESRIAIWKSALFITRDHFFIGIGPGMFEKYYLDYQRYFSPYPEWAVPQPHNIFWAFWLQTGLIGLIGFVWLLAVFFMAIKKRPSGLSLLAGAVMTYILVHGLIDTTFWKNDLAIIFWLVVALGIAKQPKNHLRR